MSITRRGFLTVLGVGAAIPFIPKEDGIPPAVVRQMVDNAHSLSNPAGLSPVYMTKSIGSGHRATEHGDFCMDCGATGIEIVELAPDCKTTISLGRRA